MHPLGKLLILLVLLLGALTEIERLYGDSIAAAFPLILFIIISIPIILLAVFLRRPEPKGARFLSFWEQVRLFSRFNKGFLIDGHKRRLSQKVSFQSILAIGGMGTGKTSTLVLPNLYTLANEELSFVVTDTSGELYEQSSQYLADQGFNIVTFNLMDVHASERYNPLANLNSYTDVAQAAHVIINSALSDERGDPFWSSGAEKLLRVLIQCLKNRGNAEECNLANLKFLINNFDVFSGREESRLNRFVAESTLQDVSTFVDFQGFLSGNSRTIQSFLSTADTALSPLGNPDVAQLTSTSTIDFSMLRKQKSILYVMVRQQDMGFFSFLLNLFYSQLFNSLLSERDPQHLPVYLLLDEFGHLKIPNFDVIATTSRKYSIAIFAFLQGFSQLAKYGAGGQTIRDGFQTEIYMGGVGIDIAQELERRIGKTKTAIKRGGVTTHLQEHLMDAREIIQLGDNEALLMYSNKPPLVFPTRPYYRQRAMQKAALLAPYPLPKTADKNLSYVDLGTANNAAERLVREPTSFSAPVLDWREAEVHDKEIPTFVSNAPVPKRSARDVSPRSEYPQSSSNRQHIYLLEILGRYARERGYEARTAAPDSDEPADILLTKDEHTIACKLSVVHAPELELTSIRKCLEADYDQIILLGHVKGHLGKVERHVKENLSVSDIEKVLFFLPHELMEYLDSRGSKDEKKTVGGYTVKVRHAVVSEDEKSEKRQAIAKIMLESMRKIHKKHS